MVRESKARIFRRSGLLRSGALAAVLATAVPLRALDPEKLISQFTHAAWSAQDGIPGPVRAIAQTPDGYLWLGTEAGLYRFDGLHFVAWEPAFGEHLLSDSVLALYVARDGRLWIGYGSGGVSVMEGDHLRNFVAGKGVPNGILSIAEDRNGSIWVCGQYGFSRYENGVWRAVDEEMGYPAPAAQSLLVDREGKLWVATDGMDFGLSSDPVRRNTILTLAPGARRFAATGLGVAMVWSMSEGPDGAVWIADTSGRAVRRMNGAERGPGETLLESYPMCFLFDGEQSLWIGTQRGVVRRTGDLARRSDTALDGVHYDNGLSGDMVYSRFRDREGNLWFGTSGGLDRFSENKVLSFSAKEGLQPDQLTALTATGDGSVWIIGYALDKIWRLRGNRSWTAQLRAPERPGVGDILSVYGEGENSLWLGGNSELAVGRDGRFSPFEIPAVAKGAYIEAVAKGRAGDLWIALRSRQGAEHILRFQDGRWEDLSARENLPRYRCRVLYGDRTGRMWLGFEDGEVAVFESGAFRLYASKEGLPGGLVLVITEDRKGHIWVGGQGGLSQFDQNHFSTITKENGLPGNSVSGFVEDEDGSFWIAGALAILRVSEDEVEKALASASYRMRGMSFDANDGLRGLPRQREPFPTATRAADGRLWFATTEGIAAIDPRRISKNTVPPPVVMEAVRTDDKYFAASPGMQFRANTRNLVFHFTALSFTDPERVQFRYKLDGYDDSWKGPVSFREVRYTNLPPRSYRFRVLACNNDGVWNEEGAILDFAIAPAYYQTNWFRALCVAVVLASLWWVYQMRLQVLKQRQQLLERHQREITALNEQLMKAQEEERTRIAGELHDGVLQKITLLSLLLGAAKREGPTDPETAEKIREVQKKLIAVGTDIRQISHDLHPAMLQESGLPAALSAYCEDFSKAHGIPVTYEADSTVKDLSPGAALCIYRIAQEALGNVAKHSGAKQVQVRLTRANGLVCLTVADDGTGFALQGASDSGGLGLINMRERVRQLRGRLELESGNGRGTTVRAEVPFRAAAQD